VIEILFEATDLLIDRRCADSACWGRAERSEHQEQVTQRRPSAVMIFRPAPSTVAMRDVPIEKGGDGALVDRGAAEA
jgi:hypothetical protein